MLEIVLTTPDIPEKETRPVCQWVPSQRSTFKPGFLGASHPTIALASGMHLNRCTQNPKTYTSTLLSIIYPCLTIHVLKIQPRIIGHFRPRQL